MKRYNSPTSPQHLFGDEKICRYSIEKWRCRIKSLLKHLYESSQQANKRFSGDATLADAGFQTLRYKGATIVVDSHCPSGQMYFLNTKYLSFKVHAKRFFAMDDFKSLEAKDSIQARIYWMGQLVCSAPRMQALMVDGPAGY